ncbi:MAG TPA: M81 family metallopeptidase [bacterium]|nr:M81 family metallopeptidase [bacterium]
MDTGFAPAQPWPHPAGGGDPLRIAVGSLKQESNTFSPVTSDLDFFDADTRLSGEAILPFARRARIELSGFLDALDAERAIAVPLVAAHACSGGPLIRAAFDTLLEDLLRRLREELPVDAVLLALHGGLVLEDDPDAEGLILHAVREVVGSRIPVAASLDLHGHITPRMVAHVDILVGYKKYPHTDMYETGVRTARLLLDRLANRIHPTMALAKRHMILSPVRTNTDVPPFRDLMAKTDALAAGGRVLAASLFPVQPWLDVPDLGFASLVVTNDDPEGAQRIADALADQAWARRAECDPQLVPLEEAIGRALRAEHGPVVIGDSGDAPSGGAPGDSNAVLAGLFAHGVDRSGRTALLTLVDAPAVQAAHAAGVGARLTLPLGHSVSVSHGQPIPLAGVVRTLGDGRYRITGPGNAGVIVSMGRTAVMASGGIHVFLMERPTIEWDPGLYRSIGLEPQDADLVFVKSPSHFRVAYGPLASDLIMAETPGCTNCNMRALRFQHATRPLYPLDE